MPDQGTSKKSALRDLTPLWLLIALIAISVLRYETVTGSALLHEISQRLYYLPIIYATYRYGLRGGLTASLVSAALYFPHIVQRLSSRGAAINLYAETILFLVIGAVTGLLVGKEVIKARIVCKQAVRCLYTDTGRIMASYRWMWQTQRVDDGWRCQKIVSGWAWSRGGLIRLSQLFDEDFAFVLNSFDGHLDVVFLRGLLD